MTAQPLSDALLRELLDEFPRFRIVEKRNSRLSLVIHQLLRVLTFGGQTEYLTKYYTVLGGTLYVPPGWSELADVDRVILLRHEAVHLRQRRRLTFPVMAFLYLIPFFPLGLAYGRARLEWEAYRETIRATAELKGLRAARALQAPITRRFVSGAYGYMWPFPSTLDRWYGHVIAEIEAEQSARSPRRSMRGLGESE